MKLIDFLGGPIRDLLGVVKDTLDEVTTTGEEKLAAALAVAQAEQAFLLKVAEAEGEVIKEQASVIRAETASESWMARNWRPITMLTFVFIIANNYIIAPYVSAFGGNVPTLDIPNGMWALLNVGISGYVISRGAEKIMRMKYENNDV